MVYSVNYTPPFSANVKSNIGARVLKAIYTCFPPENKLSQIINRNTFKVSYSSMPNLSKAISSQNTKISRHNQPLTAEQKKLIGCNCHAVKRGDTEACPMRGECRRDKHIYQASVTPSDTKETSTYTGLPEPSFKLRWNITIPHSI